MIQYKTTSSIEELKQIIALQFSNLPQNLTDIEKKEQGFVTVQHSIELLTQMHDIHPHIIAKHGEQVIGYALSMSKIFRKEILEVPTITCINIHSGRLPMYRGMMPNFWQLLHGEQFATITVHEMTAKLDAGGIIQTRKFLLKEQDALDRVIVGTKQEGARLMMQVLADFHSFNDSVQPLDMSGASYFSFPKPEDVRTLRKMGHKMLS